MLDFYGFHAGKYIESSHGCVKKRRGFFPSKRSSLFSGWVNRWDCYFELMKLNQGKREETGDISMADPWCFWVGGFHICGCKNKGICS